MDWKGRRQSSNVEDRRGNSGGDSSGGPRRTGGGFKLGTGTIILGILAFMLLKGGGSGGIFDMLGGILGGSQGQGQAQTQQQQQSQNRNVPMPGSNPGSSRANNASTDDQMKDFLETVLYDMELTWHQEFQRSGQNYIEPKVVMFDGQIRSACGFNSAATGPFYCPGDQKVYLDTSFFSELKRLGAPGDFAMAYVIAHEVGHHIQKITGIEPKVRDLQRRANKADQNHLSVLMELQADCMAGVWGNKANNRSLLQAGDIQEGLQAAASIGDDRLQKMTRGYTSPETWTHGSSEQRQQWFRHGLQSGDIQQCDTFSAAGF